MDAKTYWLSHDGNRVDANSRDPKGLELLLLALIAVEECVSLKSPLNPPISVVIVVVLDK